MTWQDLLSKHSKNQLITEESNYEIIILFTFGMIMTTRSRVNRTSLGPNLSESYPNSSIDANINPTMSMNRISKQSHIIGKEQ